MARIILTRDRLERLRARTFGASRWLLARERRWLLFFAAGMVAVGTFLELAETVISDRELLQFDNGVLRSVAALRQPWLTISAIDLTALGAVTLRALIGLCAMVALVRMGDRRGATQLLLAMAGAQLWTEIVKHWFARERPELVYRLLEVRGYSFPSGHSSGSSTLFITLALVFMPHLRRVSDRMLLLGSACLLALSIGCSRVYLGVHYPSDVASGLTFGTGWALLLAAAFELKRPRTAGDGSVVVSTRAARS